MKQPGESQPLHCGRPLISFEDAIERLSQDQQFKATVYAMNSLLMHKGIYSAEEFELQFRQWAQKHS